MRVARRAGLPAVPATFAVPASKHHRLHGRSGAIWFYLPSSLCAMRGGWRSRAGTGRDGTWTTGVELVALFSAPPRALPQRLLLPYTFPLAALHGTLSLLPVPSSLGLYRYLRCTATFSSPVIYRLIGTDRRFAYVPVSRCVHQPFVQPVGALRSISAPAYCRVVRAPTPGRAPQRLYIAAYAFSCGGYHNTSCTWPSPFSSVAIP
jgi:hypothetical protein